MAAASGLVDPTKAGKYPVILSDALLGRPSQETYTGIRYNHRPALSSETAPATARLKKSAKDDSYNLGFEDQGDKYQYNGVRTTDDGNYVLIFDPARKAFVLHRVDSTFHMNVTRTPTDSNVESLRKQFPHLEVKTAVSRPLPKGKAAPKANASKTAAAKAKPGKSTTTAAAANSDASKTIELTLPDLSAAPPAESKTTPSASQSEPDKKPKRRALSPVESEEEEDDDDGGLTVEYPEGNPAAFRTTSSYMPAIPVMTRRFSEFANDRADEDDGFDTGGVAGIGGYGAEALEEDGYLEEEYEEEEDDDENEDDGPSGMAPTPAAAAALAAPPPRPEFIPPAVEPDRYTFDDNDSDADANDDELEGELAELEAEFEKDQNGGHESDSSVSEEE
ncbi:hypothetical protein VTJ83DRAFT_1653 [Remersonia thermophila]|uniref:Transcription elongation factor Eaf N-terminal domain-containing protein n=1 Tax=Remersonia thermophila TaxID=72144 RepID=A0ABR4DGP8_9PEZI